MLQPADPAAPDEDAGIAHLAELDGHNAVTQILLAARDSVSRQLGVELSFSRHLQDHLHVSCRTSILAYGPQEAQAMMEREIHRQLRLRRRHTLDEAERKVLDRLPPESAQGRLAQSARAPAASEAIGAAERVDVGLPYLGGISLGSPLRQLGPR